MSLIPGTNIIVDNFQYKANDFTKYTYFLTHCHTDHLSGLHPSWNYGKIYLSEGSKILLIDKFPEIEPCLETLPMNEESWVWLNEEHTEGLTVRFFDANHCPGAVMILFQGKMGTVLHTGDFRFDRRMFDNEALFPPEKRNKDNERIAIDVDHLFLDNTFADPTIDFPSQQEAYSNLLKVITDHAGFQVYIFVYTLGKEEILVNLAKHFKTRVIVDEDRYRKLKLLNYYPELFTTETDGDEWIRVFSTPDLNKMDLNKVMEENPTIFLMLTGWNDKYSKKIPYYFRCAYSSHSNHRELELFLKAIQPKDLTFTVTNRGNSAKQKQYLCDLQAKYVRLKDKDKWQMNGKQENTFVGVSAEVQDRHNPNNMKLNKKILNQETKHVFQLKAPDAQGEQKKKRGAKFVQQEVCLELSDEDEVPIKSELKKLPPKPHKEEGIDCKKEESRGGVKDEAVNVKSESFVKKEAIQSPGKRLKKNNKEEGGVQIGKKRAPNEQIKGVQTSFAPEVKKRQKIVEDDSDEDPPLECIAKQLSAACN